MRIPTTNGIVSNRQTSSGQIESGATQMAVSAFGVAASIADKYIQEKDKSATQEAINAATKKTNEWKIKNMVRTGKEAENLTKEFEDFNKGLQDELGQNLSTRSKNMFSTWNTQHSEADRMGVMIHQKNQDEFVKKASFNEGLTLAEEALRTDAKNWRKAYSIKDTTLNLGMESGVIKPEEFETKKTEVDNKFRTELGKSYYTQDKHDFIKNLDQFGFGEPEKEFYKAKYKNDLASEERERKVINTESSNLIWGKRDDMLVQAKENGEVSHLTDNGKKLISMGFPEKGNQLLEDAKTYEKVILFNSENKGKSLLELSQAAESMSVGKDLDESSLTFKANNEIKKEVKGQVKIFSKDPAQYVSKMAMGENEEETISSRLSLQKNQGIFPEKGYKALTAQETSVLRNTYLSGDEVQKVDFIMGLQKFGKHTPQVLSEIGVNSALALAPMIARDPITGEIDKRAVTALVSGAESKAFVDSDETQKSAYRSEARSTSFYKHLEKIKKAFPNNVELENTMKDVEKTLMGVSASGIDTQRGGDLFDSKIELIESRDKLIYFPKSIDADEVEIFLDAKKEAYHQKLRSGYPEEVLKAKGKQLERALRDNAKWVNTPSGFVLVDHNGAEFPDSSIGLSEIGDTKSPLAIEAKKIKNITGPMAKAALRR